MDGRLKGYLGEGFTNRCTPSTSSPSWMGTCDGNPFVTHTITKKYCAYLAGKPLICT
ncbi:hypothetical protein O9929_06095 [Vibrio lentus]|nr:hypothetical protein [Vibrio lentus]